MAKRINHEFLLSKLTKVLEYSGTTEIWVHWMVCNDKRTIMGGAVRQGNLEVSLGNMEPTKWIFTWYRQSCSFRNKRLWERNSRGIEGCALLLPSEKYLFRGIHMKHVRKRTANKKQMWLRTIYAARHTSSLRHQATLPSRQNIQNWLNGKYMWDYWTISE